MKNKKYHFDMKNQNYQAIHNTIYSQYLEDDRDDLMDMILHFYTNKPEHMIDVLIPVLYSYCVSVSLVLGLESSIDFFDDFRRTLNGEMKGFITYLNLKKDAEEVRRYGEES